MFLRKRKPNYSDEVNFAPLMDLLTGVVGAMLFVVIFAVISARDVHVKIFTPRLQGPPAGSERKVFLCTNGRVRLFDWDGSKRKLLRGAEDISFDDVPSMVIKANRRNINDGHFRYKLSYDEWGSGDEASRSISLVAEPIAGAEGETLEDLRKHSSKFMEALGLFDKRKVWITFLVDKKSVDIFQKARKKALEHDIASGWDPIKNITFPFKECIIGCRNEEGAASVGRGIQW